MRIHRRNADVAVRGLIPRRTLAVLCFATILPFGLQGAVKSTAASPGSLRKQVQIGTVYQGAGNVWCDLTNFGYMGDDNAVTPSMEWPGGSTNMYLYRGGLWIAGRDESGGLHTSVGDELEFYPQLSQARIDSFQAHGWNTFTTEEYTIVVASSEWTTNFDSANCLWYDSDEFGQPGIDDDGDGLVDEDPLDFTDNDGDGYINEDFAIVSETDTYTMYNDVWLNRHNDGGSPLGIEVIERTYAWSHHYAQNFIIWDYEIINVGLASEAANENSLMVVPDTPQDLTDVYVGIRFDGDIASLAPGTYWYDDLTAYHPEYNISYIYDADDPERIEDDTGELGLATGYLFAALLNSPMDKTGVVGIPASHNWWTIDDDPRSDELKFQYMSNGVYAVVPPTPYDYRFLQSAGPYDMAWGDTLRLVWAMGVGNGYQGMVYDAAAAHWMFNNDYGAPPVFPPENLAILEWNGSSATLIWDESTHEYLAGYNIYRATNAEGPFSMLNGENLIESWYQDTSIVAGQVYYYAVTNVDSADNESDYSNIVQLNAGAAVPPSGVRASILDGSIRIDWDAHPDPSVTGFNVYRSFSATSGFAQLNTVPVTAETFTDATAVLGETYYYAVSALNQAGYESLHSGWARITLLEGLTGRGILLVDDDDETPDREIDHAFHTMFHSFTSEDWDVEEQGIPTTADLQNYSTVIWYTDDNPTSFHAFALPDTAEEHVDNPLPAYLDLGGNLWLMGGDILFAMQSASDEDIFGSGSFARDYLHLLGGDDAGTEFNGLASLGIEGFDDIGIPGIATGTGWPDSLNPAPEAMAIYDLAGNYAPGTTAGIFYDGDDHKVVFFGVNASFYATNENPLTLDPQPMAVIAEHVLGYEFGEALIEDPPPLPTKLFEVADWGDTHIDLSWSVNEEEDFLGYRLYRARALDSSFELQNTELMRDQHTYRDSVLIEAVAYWYFVTAVDNAFQESEPSQTVMEIPGRPYTPRKPRIASQDGNNIVFEWDTDPQIGFEWGPYPQSDIVGYNLYARISGTEEYFRLNDNLIVGTSYSAVLETKVYYIALTAVDESFLESYFSEDIYVLAGATLSDGILLIDNFSWTPGCYNSHSDIAAQIDSGFMNELDYTLWDVDNQGTGIYRPENISRYSSVILYTDGGYASADFADVLTAYGLAGGNLLIAGYYNVNLGTDILSAFGFYPGFFGSGSFEGTGIYGAEGTAYENFSIDVPVEVQPRTFERVYSDENHTDEIFMVRAVDTSYVRACGVRSEMPGGNVIIILGQSLPFLDQTSQDMKDLGNYILKTEFGETGVIIETTEEPVPLAYQLYPSYPNPFNPTTVIRYDLPQTAEVRLVVYDLLGRDVVHLVDHQMEAGAHQVMWNGRDKLGRLLPSGIYIARMITPAYIKSIKMVLLK
jgi:fibronectin type 3 domain-containing protein